MRRKRVAKRYRYKYRNNRIKPRVGRKLVLAAAASVTAVAVAGASLWNLMESAAPVEAKESFGGIGKVVDSHSEGEPFVILDIVPGTASYTYTSLDGSETFEIPNISLGTMGYLTNGQTPLEESLQAAFNDHQDLFGDYEERKALAAALMPAGMDTSLLKLDYREGYAGITPDLSAENGWIQIYDSHLSPDGGAAADNHHTGLIYATAEEWIDGDKTGFDYNKVSGVFSTIGMPADGEIYEWAGMDGDYCVFFAFRPEAALQGYEVADYHQITGDWEGEYTPATQIYLLEDGVFKSAGQIQNMPENGEYPEGDEDDGQENGDGTSSDDPNGSGSGEITGPAPDDSGNTGDGSGNGGDGNGSGDTGDDSGDGGDGSGSGDTGDGSGNGGDGNGSGDTGDDSGDGGDGSGSGDTGNDSGDGGDGSGSGDTGDDSGDGGDGNDSGDTGNDSGDAGSPEDTSSDDGADGGDTTVASAGDETAGLMWHRLVAVDQTQAPPSSDNGQGEDAGKPDDAQPPVTETKPDDTKQPETETKPDDTKPPEAGTTPDGTKPPEAGTKPDDTKPPVTGTTPDGTKPPEAGTNPDDTKPPVTGTTPDGTKPPEAGANPDGTKQPGAGAQGPDMTGLPNGYYIVEFRYVSGLEEARPLYQLDGVLPVDEASIDGVPPYGTYRLVSAGTSISQTPFTAADENGSFPEGEAQNTNLLDESTIADLMKDTSADGAFVYAGAGNGTWKLEEASEEEGEGFRLLIYNAPSFFRCRNGNDWLKRYVFHSLTGDDNESEEFDIQVRTVPVERVSREDVSNADLIYLEDGLGEFLGGGAELHYHYSDLEEEILFGIIYRAVEELMPVIADYGIWETAYIDAPDAGPNPGGGQDPDTGQNPDTENAGKTLYQKLVRILFKKNLTAFYQEMETVENMLLNLDSSDYPDKTDNYYNYVNRNIYIVNDDTPLVSEDFYEPFDDEKVSRGFMEVLAAVKAENSTLDDDDKISETVSKARAVQYIINYAVGLISEFRDIRILELQPTSNSLQDVQYRNDEDEDCTIVYWKKEGVAGAGQPDSGQQILRSSKIIDVTVDVKSVGEFSGSQSDINNQYQMIFIGLDGQRLNYEKEGKKWRTDYNDEEMNGLVYSAEGDIAKEDGTRYDGIDITPQKKNALLDFMRAGYPVVVEDDFFTDRTAKDVGVDDINTDYIDDSSQMFDFLRTAINEEGDYPYQDYLYTISDVHSSAYFASQINMRRPQVRFAGDEEDRPDGGVWTIEADAEGKYRGTVPYRVVDDEGEGYSRDVNIRVYIDRNQDGRFAPDEEIYDGFSTDNGEFTIEFETPLSGILPWKLEVSDAGNSYRRDALTGYFKVSARNSVVTPIRILQVAAEAPDDNTAAKYNLELIREVEDQTLLGHYLKGAEGLTESQFEIKTMPVSGLEAQLAKNEKYLQGFDVLVLGFGPAEDLSGVSEAVRQYIAEGRGVLMSSSAALEETGRLGLAGWQLGQSDTKTYSRLGSEKDSVRYYKYEPLKSDMFYPMSYLSLLQVNDGVVGHYPYAIDAGSTLTQAVKGADYTLNLSGNGEDNSIADVTAWYCLGDSLHMETFSSYDVSLKDAANNFYLYSKGNVIYIGEDEYPYPYGNPDVEPDASADGVTECRLFVNALMAAYNVGIKNPKVSIVAGLAPDAAKIESICIPFDEQLKEISDGNMGLLDETTYVYFKIAEPNMAVDKTVRIDFYYEDSAGAPVDIGGEIVYATPFASEVWTVENNSLVNVGTEFKLVPGRVYRIKAPVIPLRNETRANADIYIVVSSSFYHLGNSDPVIGSDVVTLNRAQLFLLE